MSVSVNTNCRIGPGKDYAVKSTLLVDDIVQVYGIDPTGRYWYVNNPDLGIEYCWLSSKYATVTGAISLLPVLTPQPTATATATLTPVPDFTVYYKKIETCGPWWVDFELRNNGKVTFKSIRIDIKNPYTNGTLTSGSNDFKNLDGCNTIGTTVDVLNPTEVVTVSSPSMKKSPAGIKLIATITVCTEEDGVGICLTKTLTFKPKL